MFSHLGIDFGTKHIGLALGDKQSGVVVVHETIRNDEKSLATIVRLIQIENIECIVLGRPIDLNGRDFPVTRQMDAWKEKMQTLIDLPIIVVDERFTTSLIAPSGRSYADFGKDEMPIGCIYRRF